MFPAYPNPAVVQRMGGECIHTLASMLRLCDDGRAELRRDAAQVDVETELRLDMASGNAERTPPRLVVSPVARLTEVMGQMQQRLGHDLRLRIAREAYGEGPLVIRGARDGHVTPFCLGRWRMRADGWPARTVELSLANDTEGGVAVLLSRSCHCPQEARVPGWVSSGRVDVDGDNLVITTETKLGVLDLHGGRLRLRQLQADHLEVHPESYMPWLPEGAQPLVTLSEAAPLGGLDSPPPRRWGVDLPLMRSMWRSPDRCPGYRRLQGHFRRVEVWEDYLCDFVCHDYDALVDLQSDLDDLLPRGRRKGRRRYWI